MRSSQSTVRQPRYRRAEKTQKVRSSILLAIAPRRGVVASVLCCLDEPGLAAESFMAMTSQREFREIMNKTDAVAALMQETEEYDETFKASSEIENSNAAFLIKLSTIFFPSPLVAMISA